MTDTPEHDPPLSADQEAAVRRALADAGGPEPLPGEVAERLDRVIAGLASERAAATTAVADPAAPDARGAVVPMDPAARRRRTRVRMVLGAAAAGVAVVVGAGLLSGGTGGIDAADQMAEGNPTRSENTAAGEGAPADETPNRVTSEDGGAVAERGTDSDARRVVTRERLRTVRPDHLREDLVAVQRASLPHPAAADYGETTLTAPKGFVCEDAPYGDGYLVGVAYAGESAVVAFREPLGSTQVAEVLACGTGDVLHSTTIPIGG